MYCSHLAPGGTRDARANLVACSMPWFPLTRLHLSRSKRKQHLSKSSNISGGISKYLKNLKMTSRPRTKGRYLEICPISLKDPPVRMTWSNKIHPDLPIAGSTAKLGIVIPVFVYPQTNSPNGGDSSFLMWHSMIGSHNHETYLAQECNPVLSNIYIYNLVQFDSQELYLHHLSYSGTYATGSPRFRVTSLKHLPQPATVASVQFHRDSRPQWPERPERPEWPEWPEWAGLNRWRSSRMGTANERCTSSLAQLVQITSNN